MSIGEAQVEQHDVPVSTQPEYDRVGGGARFTELHAARELLQELDEPATNQRVIVYNEDSNHHLIGSRVVGTMPPRAFPRRRAARLQEHHRVRRPAPASPGCRGNPDRSRPSR